jgi:hypothetical protein
LNSFGFWDTIRSVRSKSPDISEEHAPSNAIPPASTSVSYSAYSSTLKMEAICSSEISVDFQRTARRYTPEDITLHNLHCENLKSYMKYISLQTFLILYVRDWMKQYESYWIAGPVTEYGGGNTKNVQLSN